MSSISSYVNKFESESTIIFIFILIVLFISFLYDALFHLSLTISRSVNSHKSQANEERKVKLERERMKYKSVKVNLENSEKNTMKAEEVAR